MDLFRINLSALPDGQIAVGEDSATGRRRRKEQRREAVAAEDGGDGDGGGESVPWPPPRARLGFIRMETGFQKPAAGF